MAVTVVSAVVGTYVASAATSYLVGAAVGATAATLIGSTVGAVVAGYVAGEMADDPVSGAMTPDAGDTADTVENTASGMLVNKASNNAPIPIVYGLRKVGGTRVFMETTGSSNEYLHIVLAMSEGTINSFENVYFNDVISTDASLSSKNTIYKHLGAEDQTADSNLVSAVSAWTSSHRLKGTAYLYCKLEYDQDTWIRGVPTITADVKGVKVYDTRDASTAWSDNPALCIRDYLTNTRYGRGISTSDIDDSSITAAANYCDETVSIGGATVKRYTCDGVVNTSTGSMTILRKLLTSCRGFLVFTGGKYRLLIDKAETAVFTFSEDNIVGNWHIGLGNKSNQYNRISANFFNPDRQWQPDKAVVESSSMRTDDNGLLLEKSIELPFTADIDRAKMISTINLNQSRQQLYVSFTATIEALRNEIGDVVYVKHPTTGWDTLNANAGKKFRVIKMRLKNNDEVEVSLQEYDATVFDFGTIAAADATPDVNLPDMASVVAPTSLATVESLYETINSSGVKCRVVLSWTASADAFVKEYNVQFKLSADSSWTNVTTTTTTSVRLDDVNPALHDFRVRAVNTVGVSSSWTTLSNVTISGLTAAPEDVDNLSFISLGGYAHLTWDKAPDLDVRVGGHVRFRHSNLTTGAAWASSTDIGTAVAGHNTQAVLPLLAGTYMAKFVDSSGNESVNVSSFVTTTVPNLVPMNAVVTSTQHPNFTGTKTNMVAVDDVLKFEADTLWDSVSGLMDTWTYIDAVGGLDASSSYEFDTYIDLGYVFTSRATATLAFTSYTLGDFIDDRTTYMDSWIDFDNIPSDVNVDLYVATTTDNPASSPTWTDWAKFTVADNSCRALKFKLAASSGDPTHQLSVSGLEVVVEMPDRIQGDQGISTGAGVKSITYPSQWKALPALGLTFVDLDENDVIEVTNETVTGFDVSVKQGVSYHDHVFNWQARGY